MSSPEIYRSHNLYEWEKRKFGRNRWAELQARGGEVADDLLDDKLVVSVDRVQ